MEINLIVLEGKHRGEKICLPRSQFVIGRDGSCHLRPVSTDVSKFHCAIARSGDRVLLRDLKSTNGTYVNDRRVAGTARIGDGDILRVGPLKFLVQIVEDAAVKAGSDSQLEWLLRTPDEQEKKVLDPASDTAIIKGFGASDTPAPGTTPENTTAVAGRFLREQLDTRKKKKD